MQESDEQASDVLQIVNKHCVAQFLFRVVVAASVWEVLSLVALDSRLGSILGATHGLSQKLIKGLQMVFDPIVLFLSVVLGEYV